MSLCGIQQDRLLDRNGMDSKPVILIGSLGKGHQIVNGNRKPLYYELGEHITESFSQLIQGNYSKPSRDNMIFLFNSIM